MSDHHQHLFWYQRENIDKLIDKILNIDFSLIEEVKYFKQQLSVEISKNIDFHMQLHITINDTGDLHDCKEFEKREIFGRKLVRILQETIEDLENA